MKNEITLTNTVNQSNELSQKLQYHDKMSVLTAQEKNIIFFLSSCIDPDDQHFEEISLKISDFANLLHIDLRGGKQRMLLEDALYRLRTKGFWIVSNNSKRKEIGCWLSKAVIDYSSGYVTLKLDDTLRPFFLNLHESARTIFQLGYTVSFKRKHSCDLYALCKSAAGLKYWVIPYRELQGLLGGGYDRYYNMSKKVLEPCIDEINTKSDILVEVKPIKDKNKISSVSFKIRNKTHKEKLRMGIEQLKFGNTSRGKDSHMVAVSAFPELLCDLTADDSCRLSAQEDKMRFKIISSPR